MAEPTRRDMLRLAGAAALWASCGDNLASKPPNDSIGSAIFEARSDSFIVSLWSTGAQMVTVEISDELGVVQSVLAPVIAQQARVVASGLNPATQYSVSLVTDDGTLMQHAVRTAPALDDTRAVRIAVSADLDPQPSFDSDIFDQIIAADPDVFFTIGDVPYTDDGPVALTVAEYRQRHGLIRTAPYLRPWLEAMGLVSIYDDHEFRNDWDASRVAAEPERYAAAMQVWDEFFPLHATAPATDVRYRNFQWGANVECFVLDCRRFRSVNDQPDDAQKTMLGATQKAWFLGALARSSAPFKLVFTSVPLDYGVGVDHWAGYTTEREEILAAIKAMGTPGVLFLSGDQHYFAAYSHSFGLREFQVGPLRRGLGTPGPTGPGVLYRDLRFNFGVLDITADSLTISGVGPGGDVFYKETFSSAQLAPM
ncbi:MAG: alkaline phosphatase D family protein [Deltaproteobacteria bacterium]